MKTSLYLFSNDSWQESNKNSLSNAKDADLVLAFGGKKLLDDSRTLDMLKQKFPKAEIAMCSTAGEIYDVSVYDNTISVAAVQLNSTPIETHQIKMKDGEDSYEAGRRLMQQFKKEGLSYVLVLSDGSNVNGTELVSGMNSITGNILITGGLAGDGSDFHSTLVGLNSQPEEKNIAAIGFYGNKIIVRHGSQGGWETFGMEKTVTKAKHNILYEIDNKNALDIYKKYLGAEAESLPGSALLFPLSVILPDTGEQVVRTILSINQGEGSMTFAGDIPVGAQVRFMKANFDKITNAASHAASQTFEEEKNVPQLALLISCVGRKLILQSRTDEEIEAVDDVYNHQTPLTGFYSYGELSPVVAGGQCQLHNQTMTITTFYETE